MKRTALFLVILFQGGLIFGQNDFSFIFLPDLHLYPDSAVGANFDRVAKQINDLQPDFVITGGDMIYTAKNVNEIKAKVLFDFMDVKLDQLNMPLYYTMGNHEIVGVLAESGMEISHPLWGKAMYENRYGNRYRIFTHSGWKFFLLDGIKIREKERDYTSGVDSLQIEWLKSKLLLTDKNTPIVIVIHTPLVNPYAITNSKSQALSKESETILNLFNEYNLKMVLQGHNHKYMNLFIGGIYYISGGSTSLGTEPVNDGFIRVLVNDNQEEIKFIQTNRPTKTYN